MMASSSKIYLVPGEFQLEEGALYQALLPISYAGDSPEDGGLGAEQPPHSAGGTGCCGTNRSVSYGLLTTALAE